VENALSEINLEFLLKVMPAAEAKLYRVLLQLIPAPGAESTIAASRQIEMAELAKLTGYSKRWVNELMRRLEKKNFIRTDGGSGAVKWIRLLPPGVPLLGGSKGSPNN
jgi:DNA-binding MarR family transcriptional regulator